MNVLWHPITGPDIGDDHIWWFHRTFREMSPGGHGRARFGGNGSRHRSLKGAAFGGRNGRAVDDAAPYVLALVLLGRDEASTPGEAAFKAIMLREWPTLPPTEQTLTAKSEEAGRWERRPLIEGEVRRLRDKLYAERRRNPKQFERRIAWLRETPGVRDELKRYWTALLHLDELPRRS